MFKQYEILLHFLRKSGKSGKGLSRYVTLLENLRKFPQKRYKRRVYLRQADDTQFSQKRYCTQKYHIFFQILFTIVYTPKCISLVQGTVIECA